jgi:phage tail sheath protein FI
MPEYLSPGVFIEEVPSGLKAIEGVSTSTAALVGPAERGPVPGYAWPGSPQIGLPFQPTHGFVMTPDPAPVLVTSFAAFLRTFGPPLPIPLPTDPEDYGYLGWAVRAFFDNGGRRVYIARIVGPEATPTTLRTPQGVYYRLVRSAAKTDDTLFLTSTRGLSVGQTLTFFRHSDGQLAIGAPAGAAVATGTLPAPFALLPGDQLTIATNTPLASASATVLATPATVQSLAAATFPLPDNSTLELRVGPATEPVQTITFTAADPDTPITLPAGGGATLAEIQAVLSRYATGVQVYVQGGRVVLDTDVQGTDAEIEVLAGPVQTLLGLPLGSITGGGNVPDVAHVSVADLVTLFPPPGNFSLAADGAGNLQISSTGTGSAVTLTLTEGGGGGLLSRLGLGAVSPLTVTGTTGIPPALTITGYDLQANSVQFAAAIGSALEAGDVYAVGAAVPTPAAGPQFVARSPGSWSAQISVAIANADRAPVPVSNGGVIVAGADSVPVQSVTAFYVGATVEVAYNGAAAGSRSVHQVTALNAATRVLTLDPGLAQPIAMILNPGDLPAWVRTLEIDLTIADETGAAPTETYRGMAWNQSPVADLRRHYAWQINARSRLVWVQPPNMGTPALPLPNSETFLLAHQPASTNGFPMKPLAANVGADGLPTTEAPWIGNDNGPGQRSGLTSLVDLLEVRLIAAPGKTSPAIQLALIAQCERLRYRFAILDGEEEPLAGSLTSILKHRNLYDTSFAAYYQPWLTVAIDGQQRHLPPSGFLAGLYARVDNARGVWKAPANETPFGVLGLKTHFTTGEQDLLNPRGVNLVRQFDQGGIRVWGARTLASDPDVKYINVRRTLIFLEASIDRGTQWVVFEPNTPETWSRLTDSVSSFLNTQWRDGALFGRSPEEAFFVRCDETTMTADDILNGRLICQIGVAIVRPAEFVIFRIQQITNFGQPQ